MSGDNQVDEDKYTEFFQAYFADGVALKNAIIENESSSGLIQKYVIGSVHADLACAMQ